MSNEFGQLLRIWRQRLGYSQMQLSQICNISSRHLSFLETGKSIPSRDMVLRLGHSLSLSTEDTSLLMKYAGLSAADPGNAEDPVVQRVLQAILHKHEPYPGVISNYHLEPKYLNQAALRMLDWLELDLSRFSSILDIFFSRKGVGQYMLEWEKTAQLAMRLLKMKAIAMQGDALFETNLAKMLNTRELKDIWESHSGFAGNIVPVIPVTIQLKGHTLKWEVVLSTFGTPRNVSLSEYQMEFFYPLDKPTQAFAERYLV